MEKFIGDQTTRESADDPEDAEQKSPVFQDDFGARLFHVVPKNGVPLHDPVAQDAGGQLDESEHYNQRIEENHLEQVERAVFLVHVTG